MRNDGLRRTVQAGAAAILWSCAVFGEPVAVRHQEGLVHGFLTVRTLDGALIANGDLIQRAVGARVTTQLTFRFKDGSVRDETTVFSQRGHFRLIRSHLVQKGPRFTVPLDLSIESAGGLIAVRYSDEHGQRKEEREQIDLPADLANGMTLTLLKNIGADPPPALSMIVATPKPRLVKLSISRAGDESISIGGLVRKATHYIVKVEIGGLSGLIAPLLGKQPPDSHVWILQGEAPTFIKSEGPMYAGGPVWRIEVVSPVWPTSAPLKQSRLEVLNDSIIPAAAAASADAFRLVELDRDCDGRASGGGVGGVLLHAVIEQAPERLLPDPSTVGLLISSGANEPWAPPRRRPGREFFARARAGVGGRPRDTSTRPRAP
jgi:hypothetical protein